MVTKKPIPKIGEEGQPGKRGRDGGTGGTGGRGGEGQITGGRGGPGGEGGTADSRRQTLTVIFVAVLALGVLSTMILVVNNKLERSVRRAGVAIEEIRAVQEDTQGLQAALDLAERQRQAQAKRIIQLIRSLREAGVEVPPPLPKNSSALSLGPVSAPSNGDPGSPSPSEPGQPGPEAPSEPPSSAPQPSPEPTPSPTAICFDPPSPIAGPICVGAPGG